MCAQLPFDVAETSCAPAKPCAGTDNDGEYALGIGAWAKDSSHTDVPVAVAYSILSMIYTCLSLAAFPWGSRATAWNVTPCGDWALAVEKYSDNKMNDRRV
jgi:hypothetical protein